MNKNNKGFTLAELLIVIAIIAVLVAISIPIFSSQLEKAREATDLANVRAAYAEVMAAAITDEEVEPITVSLKQKQDDFQTAGDINIGGITKANSSQWIGYPHAEGSAKVSYDPDLGAVINWNGGAVISSVGTKYGNFQTSNGRYSYYATGDTAISSYNSEGKNGFYELESGKKYTISVTYSIEGDKGVTNYGLMPGAVLLFDESGKCILDAGKTNLDLSDKSATQSGVLKDNNKKEIAGTSYEYSYNEKDNTWTYTATFTATSTENGKCYLGMNFFYRDISDSSKTTSLKKYGDYTSAKSQIEQSFTVEETSK